MKHIIKKSFDRLVKNPSIMLLLVTYFLITASCMPLMVFYFKKPVFYIMAFLILLLTGAFLAGWLGMIKYIVTYEDENDPIEDFQNRCNAFKTGFFSSIPRRMFSVIFFIVLFIGVAMGLLYLANIIFGDPSELLTQIAYFASDKDALLNFLSALPDETIAAVAKRSAFLYFGFLFYLFLTFYSLPSLMFNECANPFLALKKGVAALFKKPVFSLLLFVSFVIIHIAIIFVEAVSTINQILMFFALVLRIYFIAYMVVLIFSVYEENFTDNCDNGPDCIGKNDTVA